MAPSPVPLLDKSETTHPMLSLALACNAACSAILIKAVRNFVKDFRLRLGYIMRTNKQTIKQTNR